MKKAILTTVIGLAFAMSANATNKSEFWFQPGAGKSAFDMGVSTTPLTIKIDSSGTKSDSKVTSMPIEFKYTQGINETMSWNVSSDFGTDETTDSSGSKTKETGLGNINAGILANANEWFYGADASLSLSKKKEGSSTTTGTRVTGGNSLTPFAGYHVAQFGAGARVDYTYKMDVTKEKDGTETKETGGNIVALTPYWETTYATGLFGAKLGYAQVASGKSTSSGTDTDVKGYTMTTLGAYATYDVAASGTIVANVDMVNIPEYDYNSTTKVSASGTNMAVTYRMGF